MKEVTSVQLQTDLDKQRDKIIANNVSIVSKVYYKLTGRNLSSSEDEYSIGLSAINEAIDKYDENKGAKFSSFCHTVIRGRMVDYFRKKQKEVPFSSLKSDDDEGNGIVVVERKQAIQAHTDKNR